MESQQNQRYKQQQSWLDCIGDLIFKNNQIQEDENQHTQFPILQIKNSSTSNYTYIKQEPSTQLQIAINQPIQSSKSIKRSRIKDKYIDDDIFQQDLSSSQGKHKNEEVDSKQYSQERNKRNKQDKQHIYSKNYRQRKKQQLKIIQQQNQFLRKKIKQLEFRLRQKQLEINRLKNPPVEKQLLTLDQLNQKFLRKTNLMLEKTTIDPQNYAKTVYRPEDKFYEEFMRSYDEHGFGGKRKKNLINYHFNEMFQAMMRDSQRYLFLICNKCVNSEQITGLPQYQPINSMFLELMQFDEDKNNRIKHFSSNLHTYMHEFRRICHEIHRSFNKIFGFLDKVHRFMKQSYPTNMDFARKRIELQNWFQFHKYGKLMRGLRVDWLQMVKSNLQEKQQAVHPPGGKKKKKCSMANENL